MVTVKTSKTNNRLAILLVLYSSDCVKSHSNFTENMVK